jgi:hypothetical protein
VDWYLRRLFIDKVLIVVVEADAHVPRPTPTASPHLSLDKQLGIIHRKEGETASARIRHHNKSVYSRARHCCDRRSIGGVWGR